jgi:hypothetical protein
MSKTVVVFATDEAGAPLVDEAKVNYVICDAVENLIAQGIIASDDEGVFFQRQLEYVQAQSYDTLYPDLMGRECFPLNTEGGEGINTITYRSYDKRGETAIIAGKATDLPRGDISGKEYSISVRTLGNAFGYSRQELASAKVTGLPLEARKAEATRRSYEEKVNQLIWFGSAENLLHGIFGGPAGAPALTVSKTAVDGAVGGTNSTIWGVDKTPDEVIADLTAACVKVYTDTKKLFKPNKVLISVAKKQYLMNTPRSLQSDVSIMNWFLANNAFIKSAEDFKDVNELDGIYDAAGGAFDPTGESGQGFTVYVEGADNARVREPFPYMHLPVQYKGLEFEVNCYGRFAGVEMIRPAAFQHFYGI